MDADDLCSENWIEASLRKIILSDQKVIVHPELNWFFDNQNSMNHISPLAPAFLSEKHYRIPTLRMVALSSATTHFTTNTFKPYFARPKEFAV